MTRNWTRPGIGKRSVYLKNTKIRNVGFDRETILSEIRISILAFSPATKVEDMLTLAPERPTAGLCMVTKVIP